MKIIQFVFMVLFINAKLSDILINFPTFYEECYKKVQQQLTKVSRAADSRELRTASCQQESQSVTGWCLSSGKAAGCKPVRSQT